MKNFLEKLNTLSLPAAILIAGVVIGGFYYVSQINKQKSIEKQQQAKIEQEQEAKEEREQALSACIASAEENYQDRWYRECKAQGEITNKCIDINELSFNEYLKKHGLTEEEYARERNLTPLKPDDPLFIRVAGHIDYIERASDECSCGLLVSIADRINESLENNKNECFKKYPQ